MTELPARARVVVIGGGVIGCSVAYHLAHMGWRDIVLVERDQLTAGTTWHSAGLIVTFGSTSETSTEMRKYTRDLYSRLEAETGLATGLKQVGFIELAADRDRLEEYRRVSAFNRYCGVDVHEISASEVAEMFPLARTDDILAGFYVAEDGRVQPGRRDDGACPGCSPAGRVDRAGGHGHRRDGSSRRGRRGRDGSRIDRGRVRGQLRGHVGPPARRPLGRQHPAAGGRALLPDHRAGRWPRSLLAGDRGPRLVRLLPRGGRRADDRPVRAGVRALARRRRARRVLVRRDQPRLGPHGTVRRARHEPGADLVRHRHPQVLLRAGELHPRPPAGRRRGTGAAQLLRGRRPELDRHPHRRRDGARRRPLDRQRPPRRRRHRLQHRPLAHVPGEPRVPPDTHGRVTRDGVPVPLPHPLDADGRVASSCLLSITASPRPARTSATSAAGRAPIGTPAPATSPIPAL